MCKTAQLTGISFFIIVLKNLLTKRIHSEWVTCVPSPDPLVARAKVPILQHGAEVLIESALICQYLEAEFSTVGTALLPPSAVDRYQIALFEEAYSSLVGGPATKIMSAMGDEQAETEAREVILQLKP